MGGDWVMYTEDTPNAAMWTNFESHTYTFSARYL